MRNPNTVCCVCETPIYVRPSRMMPTGNYCSKRCFGSSQRSPVECPVCLRLFKPRGRGTKTCSRACSNRNRTGIKYKRGQPYNKQSNARALKKQLGELRGYSCELCAHSNWNILQVHHIIERRHGGSDELNNLLLLCPNCHTTIHYGHAIKTQ